jgi:outer membrane receptor protein involved in Fe transport
LPVDDINDQLNAFIRTLSGELRLSGTVGEHGDWLLGVNGNYDKQHEVVLGLASENSLNILQFGDTPPLNKPIFFEKGGAKSDAAVRSGSVFGDGNLKLLDDLKLTLGVRYTEESQQYAGCTFIAADNNSIIPFPYFTIASAIRRGLPAPSAADLSSQAALVAYLSGLNPTVAQGDCGSIGPDGNAGLVTGTLREHSLSYRSVLSWTPDRSTLFYGSYSRGYKSGGYPTVFSVDQSSLAPVVQERLDAYEAGAKWTTWGGHFHVDAATYYYNYKDKQLLTYFKDPIFGALQYLQNVPKSFNNGAELSATLIPFKQFYLTALGSYVRTKVVEYQGLTSQGAAFNFAGEPFNYTPRAQATLIANYTFALNQDLNLTPGASFSYTGSTNATLEHDPVFAMNDHRIYDVRLGLSPPDRRWTLTAYAQNLTNEFYRNSVIKLGDSVFAYTGQPQLYGVSLTYDLGRRR